jgi:competence protein ComEA
MWLTSQERRTLAWLGLAALAGCAALLWQRHRPPLRAYRPVGPEALTVSGSPGPVVVPAWDGALAAARRVDVNAAGAAELERLPGVGPALARRIVEDQARRGRFRTPEELSRVPGIGPKTLEALTEHVTTQ